LGRAAKAIRALGARAILSHASASDECSATGLQQLGANARFGGENRRDEPVRPGLGFASVARCDDALLRELARSGQELGLTIHGDLDSSAEALARLRSAGLLDQKCALAAAGREELRALLEAEAPRLLRVLVPPRDRLPWRLDEPGQRVGEEAVAM